MIENWNWIRNLAEAIAVQSFETGDRPLIASDVQVIILKHVPFKPGGEYMEKPRCETCGFWDRDLPGSPSGACLRVYNEPDRIWPQYHGDIKTDPRFGCVEWRAKA